MILFFYYCKVISTITILGTLLMMIRYFQELANVGVLYLCNFVDGKQAKMSETVKVGSSTCAN